MFTHNTQYTIAPQNIYSCPHVNIGANCFTISVGLTSSIISSYQASFNVFHRTTEYKNKTALIQNGFTPRTVWTPLLMQWANTWLFTVLLQKRR